MNQHPIEISDDLVVATPGDARLDQLQRAIVDYGISMQTTSNTMSAFEYLRSRDVNSRVIERVLLEPRRRRNQQ